MTIPERSIVGLSFDYGHVLGGLDLDELEARLRPVDPALRALRRQVLGRTMEAAFVAHDEALSRGEGHPHAWRALMRTLVDAALAVAPSSHHHDEVATTVEALWTAQPTRNLWRYSPEPARRLIADLHDLGVPMVITSNSEGRARELFIELGLVTYFREVLDSGRLGFAKPDRRIFELACQVLEQPPQAVLHVGDSESADILGAANAGLWTLRYDGFVPGAAAQLTTANLRAANYRELREHLARVLVRGAGLAKSVSD